MVKQRIEITDGKLRAAFIVSRAIVGTNLSKDIGATLEEYDLPVLSTQIHQRVDYPKTAARGLTVLDQRNVEAEAVKEVNALTDEVLAIVTEIQEAVA